MPRIKTIRVLLCNKHNLFREGIKALLEEKPSLEVVGEASTASDALRLMKTVRPDVVLMDETTSDASGPDAIRNFKEIDPAVEVLILSIHDDELLISNCLNAGAAGYIRKNDPPLHLKRAIDTAYRKAHRAA